MLKNLLFPLHFLFFPLPFSAQVSSKDTAQAPQPPATDQGYEHINYSIQPVFPGGERALLKYLADSISYPVGADIHKIQGSLIVVSFEILEDGAVSDVKILKDIGCGYGAEVARVVCGMPSWTPGQFSGKPVSMRFTLPIRVHLE